MRHRSLATTAPVADHADPNSGAVNTVTAAHRNHLPADAASGPPRFRVPPNVPHTHPGSGPELLPYGRVLRPRLPREGTASRCLRMLGLNRLNQQGDNGESPEQSTPSGAGA